MKGLAEIFHKLVTFIKGDVMMATTRSDKVVFAAYDVKIQNAVRRDMLPYFEGRIIAHGFDDGPQNTGVGHITDVLLRSSPTMVVTFLSDLGTQERKTILAAIMRQVPLIIVAHQKTGKLWVDLALLCKSLPVHPEQVINVGTPIGDSWKLFPPEMYEKRLCDVSISMVPHIIDNIGMKVTAELPPIRGPYAGNMGN